MSAPDFRVRVEGDGACECTLAEFFDANELDREERAAIIALAPGESVVLGGGAAGEFRVTRIAEAISIVVRGRRVAEITAHLDVAGMHPVMQSSPAGRDVYVVHVCTTRDAVERMVPPELLHGAMICADALEAMRAVPAALPEAA